MFEKLIKVLEEIRDELKRINSGWEPPFDPEEKDREWKQTYTYQKLVEMEEECRKNEM